MNEFFEVMDPSLRVFWYVAIAASIIFIIQTVITFIGIDADSGSVEDIDGNFDALHHPFQFFSLRNLINFFLGFGWGGISLYNLIDNSILLGVVAFGIGIVFIFIFFVIMKLIMKLAEDNTFRLEESLGHTADVYMTIPSNKTGKGKIFISVRGSTHELDAITLNKESIKSGSMVKVTSIEGNTLIVDPI